MQTPPSFSADDAVALAFVRDFAIAERTLKSAGFCKPRRALVDVSDVAPDWDKFANDLRWRLGDASAEVARAVQLLADAPPRKHVVDQDGSLGWRLTERTPGIRDESHLLMLVRRIRNNLFHGDKSLLGGAVPDQRDIDLVRSAHVILAAAMDRLRTGGLTAQ